MENFHFETHQLITAMILMTSEYLLVLLSVTADLMSGLRKARQRGEARRSKALRLTVDKLCRYYNALFAVSVIDVMQMSAVEYLRVVCHYDIPMIPAITLLGSIGIAVIEVKSIFEKAEEKEQTEIRNVAWMLAKLLKERDLEKLLKK